MKKKIGGIFSGAIMMLTAMLSGAFGADAFLRNMELGDEFATGAIIAFVVGASILFFYFSIFLHTIIHESGHLIFGWISGYSFSSFRIASFMWIKRNGKIQRKWYSLMGTLGQCLMVPPDRREEEIPYLLYNMGGVITNGVTSVLFLWIGMITKDGSIVPGFCIIAALVGVEFMLLNGVPIDIGGIASDGLNVLSISKSEEAKKAFLTQMYIHAYITQGVRLKDMPDMWFRLPEKESRENKMCITMAVFACSRAIDQMDFEKARELGHQLLEEENGLTGIQRWMIQAEMIYCELIGENREEEWERLNTKELKKFLRAMKKNPSVLRIQYAYSLLADQSEEKARDSLKKFERIIIKYPNECEIEGEKELITYTKKVYLSQKNLSSL